jgi:hypothetical protein
MTENLQMLVKEKENKTLPEEMELFLKQLVNQGCKICDMDGGYTDYPITGRVCPHMIRKREKRFGKRVDSLVLEVLSGNQTL